MLQLLLLRHAKAEQGGAAMADRDRPLAARGHEQSAEMGRVMADAGYRPARIFCSSARRTRETLLGILPGLLTVMPAPAEIRLDPRLYDASDRTYLDILRTTGDGASSVLFIGHNPTIQQFANGMSGGGTRALRDAISGKFPTAALAVIKFEAVVWSAVEPGTGQLTAFIESAV